MLPDHTAVVVQRHRPGVALQPVRGRAGGVQLQAVGGRGQGLCQRADAQLRTLQVDEQLPDAGCADHGQPVGVRRQRPVGKIHADAGHAGFHHVLQDRRLCAGRADGTIKIQGSFPRFIFYF